MVYCSDEFSRMMGYPRSDIMQSPAAGDFMSGALTEPETVSKSDHNYKCYVGELPDMMSASRGEGIMEKRT